MRPVWDAVRVLASNLFVSAALLEPFWRVASSVRARCRDSFGQVSTNLFVGVGTQATH